MIRFALHSDIPAMLVLGEAMHEESRFRSRPWNTEKVRKLLAWLIDDPDGIALVAEDDGRIIGGFMGMVQDHWCTDSRESCDLALYVTPEHRGGLTAARLLNKYRNWAHERGADSVLLGITTGVDLATSTRLFERLGFQHVGHLFEEKH
ncbi:GNAT family N-acetyltransferase [Xanthomonas rydalmerensis]|uniref:GNAT family N-acetyltransferase n=1 Tax=Xanthomonas rydalmerensis TaxID=3046274 RepID=A0ABZ0JNR2_9XANT|nr:GNAT family N-acetyltransferase [Xanthomonas sp. DM-2023]WOS40680.1 GNAT family N-acetyltransferase [Xanthomonas sp. DM-2023]WOS44864.1 GNAT family N-acetyltransferase [Xanthomonas sp. DM-2023]WOS49044.1 GNAT family N-acetyltransferase [Xanthomonas sp. DM-2023]WOS53224.1 GNAT family N-acetyltransferase [Xanthomonas sp. DM-2023]WOS57407.1 GNAT family N-acetyltransferase [Xanthomonas sp. DM-2023]